MSEAITILCARPCTHKIQHVPPVLLLPFKQRDTWQPTQKWTCGQDLVYSRWTASGIRLMTSVLMSGTSLLFFSGWGPSCNQCRNEGQLKQAQLSYRAHCHQLWEIRLKCLKFYLANMTQHYLLSKTIYPQRPVLIWHGAARSQGGSWEQIFLADVNEAYRYAATVVHTHIGLISTVKQYFHNVNI